MIPIQDHILRDAVNSIIVTGMDSAVKKKFGSHHQSQEDKGWS